MSNHRARTWDHRESKSLGPKLLPLGHHLIIDSSSSSSNENINIIEIVAHVKKYIPIFTYFDSRNIRVASSFFYTSCKYSTCSRESWQCQLSTHKSANYRLNWKFE
jgi:hypothetical protein